jgi:RNA polymerase sigma factor (sigma-70 family)
MAVMQPEEASAVPGCETIEELFAALESPLLGYALRLTGEIGAAEDLVQEAFMNLQSQFQSVRQPRRWLYRTVHNLALNHRRQSAKIVSLPPAAQDDSRAFANAPDLADPKPLPDEQLIRLEGIGLVRLTLETLDARSRELIRLKFNEDLSYKEIAARTGLTIGHVGYILHCALKKMAEELAKDGIIP